MQSFISIQQKLSEFIAVSGHEEPVRAFVQDYIQNKVDRIWQNPMGSLFASIQSPLGGNTNAPRIMVDAHMDEVGLIINHIDAAGFAYFATMGGWDSRIFSGLSVKLLSQNNQIVEGCIGSKPPHLITPEESSKAVKLKEMYIDFGFQSRHQAEEAGLKIGCTGAPYAPFLEMANKRIRAKALDDRAGVNILLHLIDHFSLPENRKKLRENLVFSFSVQEEVGLKGAGAAARTIQPDYAIVVEATTAGDVPGTSDQESPAVLGQGPALTLVDKTFIAHPAMNRRLIHYAEQEKIPFQFKKPTYGGTNAGEIYNALQGIPTAVLSVPCRYIHSPVSILDLNDLYNTWMLLCHFLENPQGLTIS